MSLQTILKFPPVSLVKTTNITNQLYGNGTYTTNACNSTTQVNAFSNGTSSWQGSTMTCNSKTSDGKSYNSDQNQQNPLMRLDLTDPKANEIISVNQCRATSNCNGFMFDSNQYTSWLEKSFQTSPVDPNSQYVNTITINPINSSSSPLKYQNSESFIPPSFNISLI